MAKPLTREQEIVKKLRAAAYINREDRVQMVKDGQLPYDHLTDDELLEILPGRRIQWLANVSHLTPQVNDPLWKECEEVVSDTGKRMVIDRGRGILEFQTREWQSRVVRLDRIFEITIRVIPQRELPKATTRGGRRRQLTKRLVVG